MYPRQRGHIDAGVDDARRSFPISISMRLLGKLRIDDSEHPVGKDHSWNQNIPNEEVLTGCN
jgi:hypothetical protein